MKRTVVLASIALSILAAYGARAAESKPGSQQKKIAEKPEAGRSLMIRVEDGDWGDAQPREIETLLYAVANEMLTHFPERQLAAIVVSPSRRGPIVLYEKGPAGEYQVWLAAKGRLWPEFVYEFSHEFLHILVNYEYHAAPRSFRHQWFEEALCETVALHTLKRLSEVWETSPQQPEWGRYAAALRRYADLVVNEPHRRLPDSMSLAQWFRENESVLGANAYFRAKNELVANLFLPLLENNANWQALAFLNQNSQAAQTRFQDHLVGWYGRTPQQHKEFVRYALKLFEFDPGETALLSR